MQKRLADTYNRAKALEDDGRIEEAVSLFRACLAMDPTDRAGVSMRLASMGLASAPDRAPEAYVAALFDQHAEDFDDILTGDLGYAVPMQLAAWLEENRPGPYRRLVDLGCGTGLSGMMLLEMAEHATGVDIAEAMIEKSDERAAYDALYVNEVVHFLEEWAKSDDPEHAPFDLIVATDVLPYLGALEPLFDGIAANATPGARLCFSAETLPELEESGGTWSITPKRRFAHSRAYLEDMCARAGFIDIDWMEPIVVRMDERQPIPGWLVVASRP